METNSAMAKSDLHKLRAAHATAAKLVMIDPIYAPIFERLEIELKAAEATETGDVIAQARAILACQKAML
jgi:hypothetical protein